MIDINSQKLISYNIVLTYKCNLNCKHCFNVKTNEVMSEDLLDKANKFVCDHINSHTIPEFEVQYIGGEIGIVDQNLIKSSVEYIKNHTPWKKVRFLYQSNLAYELTDSHIEVLKLMDIIGTSYDYNIRFTTAKQRSLWFKNIKYLQSLGKNIQLVVTETKPLIKNVTPTMLLDFVMALDIHTLILNGCAINNESNKLMAPKGEEAREWNYKLFLLYEKLKKSYDIRINEIENTIDSYYGKKEFIHSRCCSLNNLTIQPNGDITTCIILSDRIIGNLLTNEAKYTLDEVWNMEKQVDPRCLECKYFCYCNGCCQTFPIDETGCIVPYKIYEHLKAKESINE